MVTSADKQSELRKQNDQRELAEQIARLLPHDGSVEFYPHIFLHRSSKPTEPIYGFFEPAFCVVAQGSKDILLGKDCLRYDSIHYLITTVELPVAGQVVRASAFSPFLSFRLTLDPAMVASVMMESGTVPPIHNSGVKAIAVSALDENLLDATLRLVRLIDKPVDCRILAPLIIREIVYRLLIGDQGSRMHHLATFGGQAHRMVRAIEKLRTNLNKSVTIKQYAREFGMSVSSFHSQFKAVTSMSPLQFQKQLRLQEARRLMLSEGLNAAEASYRVGYENASHFGREYRRYFGTPPSHDIKKIRKSL